MGRMTGKVSESPQPGDLAGDQENFSPRRLLLVTIGGIFMAEVVAMIVIYFFRSLPYYQQVLADGIIMTVLIVPILYYLSFKPLILHIEERYQAEKALQASNERFAKAFHSNAAAVSITSLVDGRFIEVNEAFLNTFGYSREEIVGRTSTELNIYRNPGERTHIVRLLREAGSVRNYDLVAQIKNGELRNMEVFLEQIELDGEACILATLNDITERKQAEEQLAHQNQELLELTNAERKQRQTAEALCVAAQSLTQTLRLEHVVDSLLDHINKIIPYDSASVALLEDEVHLALRAVRGNGHWTDFSAFLTEHETTDSIIQELFSSRKSLLISKLADDPVHEIAPKVEHLQSWLVAPIVTGEKAIGVVWLGKNEPEFFAEEHAEWTEALVGQAGVAIQNAWLFEQVRANSERLQFLSHRLVEIQESERRYIARELHDEAGQSLTTLMVDLRILEKKASQPEAVIKTIAEMEKTLVEVIDNLHRLAMALRPASLDQLGLVAALRQQAESIGDKTGLQVRFKTDGIKTRLPANMETVLYRIAQEALTNIVRHAHASRVDVVLKRHNDKLILIIEDDGIGFDPNAVKINGHLGLIGMRERVDMIEGKLIVESAPGKGTTILVEVTNADPVINRG